MVSSASARLDDASVVANVVDATSRTLRLDKVARLMAVQESLPCRTAARLFDHSSFHSSEKEGSK